MPNCKKGHGGKRRRLDKPIADEPQPQSSSNNLNSNTPQKEPIEPPKDAQDPPPSHLDLDPLQQLQLDDKGALRNELILKEILEKFPLADLLELSLVDHFWASCARTVLRTKNKCFAFLRRSFLCLDLSRLDSLLETSSNIPFNGLSVLPAAPDADTWCCSYEALHGDAQQDSSPIDFCPNLLKFSWKHLNMDVSIWAGTEEDYETCLGQATLQAIMGNNRTNLEGLSVSVSHWDDDLMKKVEQEDEETLESLGLTANNAFPSLKHVEVTPTTTRRSNCAHFLRKLLTVAPNVNTISGGAISWNHLEHLMDIRKLHLVKQINFNLFKPGMIFRRPDPPVDHERSNKLEWRLSVLLKCVRMQPQPKLRKLSLLSSESMHLLVKNPDTWLPKLCEIYTGLLSASWDTLQELVIDHLDLVLLSRLQLQPFPSLRTIVINTRNYYLFRLAYALSRFDYSQLFPNVHSVSIQSVYSQYSQSTIEGEGFYTGVEPWESKPYVSKVGKYTWPSVREFAHYGDKTGLGRFEKVFPNVKSVRFSCNQPAARFGSFLDYLWTAWSEVESITFVEIHFAQFAYRCMDEYFVGLKETKCAVIRKAISNGKDPLEFIQCKKYRRGPSIVDLTNLKTFRLEFSHYFCGCATCGSRDDDDDDEEEEIFLTEVTKKCALDRMPSLNFQLRGKTCKCRLCGWTVPCRFSLKHLEPNVKLVIA